MIDKYVSKWYNGIRKFRKDPRTKRTLRRQELIKIYAVYFQRKGTNHLVGYSTKELNYSASELIRMGAADVLPKWYRQVKAIGEDWGFNDGYVYTREVAVD